MKKKGLFLCTHNSRPGRGANSPGRAEVFRNKGILGASQIRNRLVMIGLAGCVAMFGVKVMGLKELVWR